MHGAVRLLHTCNQTIPSNDVCVCCLMFLQANVSTWRPGGALAVAVRDVFDN
jgi:hypothetical protein